MRITRHVLYPPTATSRPSLESPLSQRNQLQALPLTLPRREGAWLRQGIARVDEHALGSVWEFAVVSAHTSHPTIPVIRREHPARLKANIGAESRVDNRPNETCGEV